MRKILGKRILATLLALGMMVSTNGFGTLTSTITAQAASTTASDYSYSYEVSSTTNTEQSVAFEDGYLVGSVFQAAAGTDEPTAQILQTITLPTTTATTSGIYNYVYVYTDLTDATDPTSGTVAYTKKNVSSEKTSIDISDQSIKVMSGEYFSVVLKVSPDDEKLKFVTYDDDDAIDTYYSTDSSTWSSLINSDSAVADIGTAVSSIGTEVDLSSDGTVTFNSGSGIDDQSYTGSAIVPSDVTVEFEGTTLTEDTDYEVTCSDNKNVGTATYSITGTGFYEGTVETTFEIRYDLTDSDASISTIDDQAYTGSAITLTSGTDYTVEYDGTTLTEGEDYEVSYADNTDVGTATMTVTGLNDYMGEATQTFDILYDLNTTDGFTSISTIDDQAYTGSAITPTPTITYCNTNSMTESVTLEEGTDYTLTYSDNTAVGEATITVNGCGDYTGSFTTTFNICYELNDTDGLTVISDIDDLVYDGAVHNPTDFTVAYDGTELTSSDYDVTYEDDDSAVGEHEITIDGLGNYIGTATATYNVCYELNNTDTYTNISELSDMPYTGSAQTQDITVTYYNTNTMTGAVTLEEGTDYEVTYTDNTSAGEATVTITGIGDYTGSVSKTFDIYYDISAYDSSGSALTVISDIADQAFTGSAVTPSAGTDFVVTYNGATLTPGTDYTVSYSNNTYVSDTSVVTITGENLYQGSVSTTFNICYELNDTDGYTTFADIDDYVYTGTTLTPSITAYYYNTADGSPMTSQVTLTEGTDYEVSYADNKAIGTATVTITGEGDYMGEATTTFSICTELNDTDGLTVISDIADQAYTGEAIELTAGTDFTVAYNGTTLTAGTDYEIVSYDNNTDVGTATVTIEGIGYYTGTATAEFSICYDFSDTSLCIITVDDTSCYYSLLEEEQVPTITVQYYVDGALTTLTEDSDYTVTCSNNVDAGSDAVYTVTGMGDYTGTRTGTFEIAQLEVVEDTTGYEEGAAESAENFTVSIDTDSYDYTGSAIKLDEDDITMTYTYEDENEEEQTIDIDSSNFLLTYPTTSYKTTGTKYIYLYLSGDNISSLHGDTVSDESYYWVISYTVTALSISDYTATISSDTYAYTGSAITPTVTVTNGSTTFSSSNYTVTYTNNTDVGTATITIAGSGDYGGSITLNFDIVYDISEAEVTIDDLTYNLGKSLTPDTTVTISPSGSDITLTSGTDYTLTYYSDSSCSTEVSTITDAGTYYAKVVAVSGQSSYFDSSTSDTVYSFEVAQRDLSYYDDDDDTYINVTTSQCYTGSTISVDDLDLTVILTDPTTGATGTLSDDDYYIYSKVYSDSAHSTVTTIVDVDTYYIRLYVDSDGSGNYVDGTYVDVSFVLNGKSVKDESITISTINDIEYDETGSTTEYIPEPVPTVYDETREEYLECGEGKDYTITYSSNTAVGTAIAKITGIGNYTGYVNKAYYICYPLDWDDITIGGSVITNDSSANTDDTLLVTEDATELTYKYTGSDKIISNIKVKYNSNILTGYNYTDASTDVSSDEDYANADYIMDYTENDSLSTAGEKVVYLTGQNAYTNTFAIYYILQVPVTYATISSISDQMYTGSAIEPTVVVTMDGTTLLQNIDYTLTYTNNTDAALTTDSNPPTVTITGMGNYTGSVSTTFNIVYDLTETDDDGDALTVISDIDTQAYTGEAIEPDLTVTYDGTTLTEDTDYTVEYTDNTEVGTATATITGMGLYSGTVSTTFDIAYGLEDEDVEDIDTQAFTGEAIEPDLTVTYDGTTLTKDTDYTVEFTDNTEVGTATATITGIGDYSGTVTKTFSIRYDIGEDGALTCEIAEQTYTGSAITLTADDITTMSYTNSLADDGAGFTYDLTYDTDYTLTYEDNTDAGTATVTITPDSSSAYFTGTATATFTINPKSITDDSITVGNIEDQTWNATEQTPVPVITDETRNVELTNDTDFTLTYEDNIIVGEATVTITGTGNYTDSREATFTIVDTTTGSLVAAISEDEEYVYTGSEIEPTVVVTSQTYSTVSTATEGTDYTLSYENNVDAGTGTVIVTGVEDTVYEGQEVEVDFTIEQADLADVTVEGPEDQIYTGSALKPEVVLTYNDMTLTEDTDYTVDYSNNVSVTTSTSKASVTITAVDGGNYTGSITEEFSIGYDITEVATVTLSEDTYTYDGTEKEPTATVTIEESGTTETLTEDTDYTVSYEDNVDAGTGTVVVTGTGGGSTSYVGSIETEFTINPLTITDDGVTISDMDSVEKTGAELTPDVTMTYNDETLTQGTDYTLSYENNVDTGTATVTITGCGNFTDATTTTFEITAKQISSSDITIAAIADRTYNGNKKKPSPEITDTTSGEVLTKNTDYTLSYENNKNAGEATVTITGTGEYTGKTTTTFNIIASLTEATVTYEDEQVYTGSAVKPTVEVTCGGNTLTEGTDYTIAYTNNTAEGTDTASFTITAVSGSYYTDSITKTFSILYDISTTSVDSTSYASIYTYTGSAITPDLVVTNGSTTLTEGEDYTLSYENNTNVTKSSDKKGTVTITGSGDYTGTKKVTFWISQCAVGTLSFSDVADVKYTGSARTPSVTIKNSSTKLTKGTDYTISYKNNKKVGTAQVIVTGTGNYSGTNTIPFSIYAGTVSTVKVKSVGSTTAKLSWSSVTGASGYEVWTSNNKTKLASVSGKTSVKLTKLKSKKYYKVTVRAYVLQSGQKAYGSFSNEKAFSTRPKTPSKLKVSSTSSGKVKIKWSKVSGKGYEIYVASSKKGSYKKLKTISKSSTLSYTDKKGTSGKKRYYKIRAYATVNGSKVYSKFSSVKKVKVK
ncbi:MAG: hypothetical protein K6G01_04590 [Eubacterium sp.]|nr:hypothetical protein [Eubacterium sp.]